MKNPVLTSDFNEEDYLRLKDSYILTPEKMKLAKDDTCILHPLPRVNEISVDVDDDKRACYFKQVLNAKYMRMALILKLLSESDTPKISESFSSPEYISGGLKCKNPRCISTTEQELDQIFKITDSENSVCRCVWCEEKLSYKK